MRIPQNIRTFAAVLLRAGHDFQRDDCFHMAAAISYYVLFSLFPLLIFLVSLLGLLLENTELQGKLIEAVVGFIPVSDQIEENILVGAIRQISGISSGAVSILGLLALAWSGSNMFAVIRHSVNVAYDLEIRRPYVKQKLLDLTMVLGVGLFMLFSVISTGILAALSEWSARWNFLSEIGLVNILTGKTGLLSRFGSYLIPFLFTLIAFATVYWIVPAVRPSLRDVLPGAIVATFLFEICKTTFVFYVDRFAKYDLIFGSLGAVAAFLFWVYLSAVVFLFGAEIVSEYPRVLQASQTSK